MLAEAIANPAGRKFFRNGWAGPWVPCAAMLAYMISHDAHREQVCLLAHQLGYPLWEGYGIWNWERLWSNAGPHTRGESLARVGD
jgi:hypothetical protein